MSVLNWSGVTLTRRGRVIVDSVSLTARRGEVLGILGPNGAGKSSLLRLAAGLDRPDRGTVALDGTELSAMSVPARARAIAYQPQQVEAAWPISVQDAVALGRLPHGNGTRGTDRAAVERALAAVEMTEAASRPITTLSGGERALVLLARALAVESDLLLLDEPVAALDPYHQLAAMTLFDRLADAGKTVVVVLHDLQLAARFCHRVAVLHHGRLAAEGPPDLALSDDLLARVYAIRGVRDQIDGAHVLVPWHRLADDSDAP